MSRWLIGLFVCTSLLLPACGGGTGEDRGSATPQAETEAATPGAAELRAEVPALDAFHEVIHPLWHTAWPDKDTEMMKDLLPDVQKHVIAVGEAELPGILRDKKAKWDEGLTNLRGTLEKYEQAAAADDKQGLIDAVEEIHSRFEFLYRLIRPVMKELDAYHVVLYQIYHYHMPNKQLDDLRQASGELVDACKVLSETEAPRWFAEKAEAFAQEVDVLCQKTDALKTATEGDDWGAIEESVETMHTQYQTVAGLFD
jgi:hypothetical protein